MQELKGQFDRAGVLPDPIQTRVEHMDGVYIADIEFRHTLNEPMRAYWVTPPQSEPAPAVVYVHPAPGSRDTFLKEAQQMAQAGIASLVPEAPWANPKSWVEKVSRLEGNRELFTRIVLDLWRALDWVAAQSEVDAGRLGFVGHSFGALMGGVLAGVEKRVRAYVLMSGSGSFTDVAAANLPDLQGEALARYAASMSPIDPIQFVPAAAPSAVFYQIARQDEVFPLAKQEAFARAGSEPKRIGYYDAGHFLNAAAQEERIAWLTGQLGGKPLKGRKAMANKKTDVKNDKPRAGGMNKAPKKGSGAGTTKGALKRNQFGTSKAMNQGGAQGTTRRGEAKDRKK
jgi:dienelactone hydrolase